MSERAQRYLAVAVAVVLGMLAVVQVADPDVLGLTPRALAWAGIASSGLGILAGFLPRVQRSTDQPATERVRPSARHTPRSLTDEAVKQIADELEARMKATPAERAPLISKPPAWLPPTLTDDEIVRRHEALG